MMNNTAQPKKILVAGIATVLFSMMTVSPALGQFGDRLRGLAQGAKALTLSDDEVIASAAKACEYMDTQNTVAADSDPYAQRLANLTAGLENEDGLSLNFKVYQVDELNAFAMANGCVRVYTGLMDEFTDDELRGVIGHEIGHVKLGHSKDQMKKALLSGAGRDLIAAEGGTVGSLASSQLGDIAETVLQAQFSRSDESDADEYGYEFMVRNGFAPEALATGLEKLPGEGGLTSSHPGSAQRAARIREMME